jgi:hypothetical protein
MITYLLILSLWIGGERQEWIIDTGLTAEDCATAIRDNPGSPLTCESSTFQREAMRAP